MTLYDATNNLFKVKKVQLSLFTWFEDDKNLERSEHLTLSNDELNQFTTDRYSDCKEFEVSFIEATAKDCFSIVATRRLETYRK